MIGTIDMEALESVVRRAVHAELGRERLLDIMAEALESERKKITAMPRCRATTRSGRQCLYPSVDGTYCQVHLNQAQDRQKRDAVAVDAVAVDAVPDDGQS